MPDGRDQLLLRVRFASPPKSRKRTTAKRSMRKAAREGIARLKVTPQHIRPRIWGRLEVPTALSLGALHAILQITFGWTYSHLHQFHVGDHRLGIVDGELDDDMANENQARPDQIVPTYDRFLCEYDFGDSWIHVIALERLQDRESGIYAFDIDETNRRLKDLGAKRKWVRS